MLQRCGLSFLAIPVSFILVSSASAAVFRVNSAVDGSDADPTDGLCDDGTGFCTLRAAIEQSNANQEADDVILGETTYFLIGGPLVITSAVRILGEIATLSIIDGKNTGSVLQIRPTDPATRVTIKSVTLTHGSAGGLTISEGIVALEKCLISENVTGFTGGGIWIGGGRVTIDRSEVRHNGGGGCGNGGSGFGGGGIFVWGHGDEQGRFRPAKVEIRNSVVRGNVCEVGGGIFNVGRMTIVNTLIEGNAATDFSGGGIFNARVLNIRDSSIRSNHAPEGGGIANERRLIVRNSRVENNSANIGGGIFSETGVRLPGTVISGNSPDQCAGDGVFNPPCP